MDSEASSAIQLNSHIQTASDLELRTFGTSSSGGLGPQSASTSDFQADTPASNLDPSVNVQELPPVDAGRGAWTFCLAGLVLETLVWGFSFRYVAMLASYCNDLRSSMSSSVMVFSKVTTQNVAGIFHIY